MFYEEIMHDYTSVKIELLLIAIEYYSFLLWSYSIINFVYTTVTLSVCNSMGEMWFSQLLFLCKNSLSTQYVIYFICQSVSLPNIKLFGIFSLQKIYSLF